MAMREYTRIAAEDARDRAAAAADAIMHQAGIGPADERVASYLLGIVGEMDYLMETEWGNG